MDREELEKYCDELRDVFARPGWQWVIAECESAIKDADNIDNISDEKTLFFRRGEKSMARLIASLPDQVISLEEQLEDEEGNEE